MASNAYAPVPGADLAALAAAPPAAPKPRCGWFWDAGAADEDLFWSVHVARCDVLNGPSSASAARGDGDDDRPPPAAVHSAPDNSVTTAKYTALSFVPRSLFEQFRRLANQYFLVVALMMVIGTESALWCAPRRVGRFWPARRRGRARASSSASLHPTPRSRSSRSSSSCAIRIGSFVARTSRSGSAPSPVSRARPIDPLLLRACFDRASSRPVVVSIAAVVSIEQVLAAAVILDDRAALGHPLRHDDQGGTRRPQGESRSRDDAAHPAAVFASQR